jgi:hypothetical protein
MSSASCTSEWISSVTFLRVNLIYRMSHVINQRMGKRQPMCWTAEGAQCSTADWTRYSANGIRDFA